MAATFDPYHKWLAIPPKDQPPHHYRLLGIELFEPDPDVIDTAANRQMDYLRQCGTGPHTALSQKLLNEVAAARICLLNPQARAAYDQKLKTQLAPTLRPRPAPVPAAAGHDPQHPAPAAGRKSPPPQYLALGGAVLLSSVILLIVAFRSKPEPPAHDQSVPANLLAETPLAAPSPDESIPPPESPAQAAEIEAQIAAAGTAERTDTPSAADPDPRSEPTPSETPGTPVARAETPPPPAKPESPPAAPTSPTAAPPPEPMNLLRLIGPGRDAVRGEWKLLGKALVASADEQIATLQVPYVPPEEYELTLEIEPKGKPTVLIGLIFGGRPCVAVLDYEEEGKPLYSGLDSLDRRTFGDRRNPTRFEGRTLAADQPNVIKCTVLRARISIQVGETRVIDWGGNPEQVRLAPAVVIPNEHALFLCLPRRGQARITNLELTPLSSAAKGTLVTTFPKRPSGAPRDAIRFGENWYWFSPLPATAAEAAQVANRWKGRPLVISSEEENEFVTAHITGPTLLGMLKQSNEWLDATGKSPSFFNWDKGQPSSSPAEKFAVIHPSGRWHDHNPEKLRFAIEWGKE